MERARFLGKGLRSREIKHICSVSSGGDQTLELTPIQVQTNEQDGESSGES